MYELSPNPQSSVTFATVAGHWPSLRTSSALNASVQGRSKVSPCASALEVKSWRLQGGLSGVSSVPFILVSIVGISIFSRTGAAMYEDCQTSCLVFLTEGRSLLQRQPRYDTKQQDIESY